LAGTRAADIPGKEGYRIVLRDLAKADAEEMLKFANLLVREKRTNREIGVASFDKRLTREEETKFVRSNVDLAKKKQGVTTVALLGGKIVGECSLRRRGPSDLRHTGILGIVVLDGFRGMGIGEALMKEVLRKARRIGVWLVELEVVSGNDTAQRLYERMGFRKVGVIPDKILRDGVHRDMVVMYADLRGSDISTNRLRRKS
jgi:ribosomal protein S18 acetylase RimI-like enzyme